MGDAKILIYSYIQTPREYNYRKLYMMKLSPKNKKKRQECHTDLTF